LWRSIEERGTQADDPDIATWTEVVRTLVDRGFSVNLTDVSRLQAVGAQDLLRDAALLATHDPELPERERVMTSRFAYANLADPLDRLPFVLAEARLVDTPDSHPFVAARVHSAALAASRADPYAALAALAELASMERTSGDPSPAEAAATARTLICRSIVQVRTGDHDLARDQAREALLRTDAYEQWMLEGPATAANAVRALMTLRTLGEELPLEATDNEHPARVAWRQTMQFLLDEDASLDDARWTASGYDVDGTVEPETWATIAANAIPYARDPDQRAELGTEAARACLAMGRLAATYDGLAVQAAAPAHLLDDDDGSLARTRLAIGTLGAWARIYETDSAPAYLVELEERVRDEARRLGVSQLAMELSKVAPPGLAEAGPGWNLVRGFAVAAEADLRRYDPEYAAALRQAACMYHSAAYLQGLDVLPKTVLDAAPGDISPEVVHKLAALVMDDPSITAPAVTTVDRALRGRRDVEGGHGDVVRDNALALALVRRAEGAGVALKEAPANPSSTDAPIDRATTPERTSTNEVVDELLRHGAFDGDLAKLERGLGQRFWVGGLPRGAGTDDLMLQLSPRIRAIGDGAAEAGHSDIDEVAVAAPCFPWVAGAQLRDDEQFAVARSETLAALSSPASSPEIEAFLASLAPEGDQADGLEEPHGDVRRPEIDPAERSTLVLDELGPEDAEPLPDPEPEASGPDDLGDDRGTEPGGLEPY